MKNKYKIAIEKNETNRKIALNSYRNSQIELKRTMEHNITKKHRKKTKSNSTTRFQFKAILENCEAKEKKQQ